MIPDFQTIMLPLLEILADKKEYNFQSLISRICDEFKLTGEEREKLLPSGTQRIINNRVYWATIYLRKAKLADSPRRSICIITEQGLKILSAKPKRIDIKFLQTLPDFKEWRNSYQPKKDQTNNGQIEEIETEKTPEELLDFSFTKLKDELASELIDKIKNCSPAFFERLVVDLLIKMGYGGSRKEAGRVTKMSGDGGIDGVINEDKLGLDTIYIQTKRWEGSVGRPEIQKFVGALAGQGAKKGIFITTSSFSKEAREYQPKNETKIVLIDGQDLANLMIEHGVGVSTKITYEIKKMDTDYFEE